MNKQKAIESKPRYTQVETFSLPNGRVLTVGDEFYTKLSGQATGAVVRVTRIDLDDDKTLRDVTVALWSKKSGRAHPQRGMARTLSASAVFDLLT